MSEQPNFCGKWKTRDGRIIIVEEESWHSYIDQDGISHIGKSYFKADGNHVSDSKLDLMEKFRPAQENPYA